MARLGPGTRRKRGGRPIDLVVFGRSAVVVRAGRQDGKSQRKQHGALALRLNAFLFDTKWHKRGLIRSGRARPDQKAEALSRPASL